MEAVRILIVDDQGEFRTIVSEYLKSLPHVIVVGEAVDGIDAIDKTRRLDPDIVLIDISMPRCMGFEATRIIKEHWPLKQVIIVTMHDNPFYRTEAQRAGANGYILKSSLKSSLRAVVDRCVQSLGSTTEPVAKTPQRDDGLERNFSIIDRLLQERAG